MLLIFKKIIIIIIKHSKSKQGIMDGKMSGERWVLIGKIKPVWGTP